MSVKGVKRMGDFGNGVVRKMWFIPLLSPVPQHFSVFKVLSLEGLIILSWGIDLTFCLPPCIFSFGFNYYLLNESQHAIYPSVTFN